jgi:hypothetical protein
MPNFWTLSILTLQINGNLTCEFRAQHGDIIRLNWEPEDIFFETAGYKRKKIRKGYRGTITLEVFIWNDLTKADFLRMCMNAESVGIIFTEPTFEPDLTQYHLVFENLEVVEMYSENKFLLRATAKMQELLPNIPDLE